jgi:hypothetical protein
MAGRRTDLRDHPATSVWRVPLAPGVALATPGHPGQSSVLHLLPRAGQRADRLMIDKISGRVRLLGPQPQLSYPVGGSQVRYQSMAT